MYFFANIIKLIWIDKISTNSKEKRVRERREGGKKMPRNEI